ncbi:MAG: hypothetical protein IPK82_03825 [Polyangiaceae bacterium]|nr:hypothetical protein [Polyangiaceae bacterium]
MFAASFAIPTCLGSRDETSAAAPTTSASAPAPVTSATAEPVRGPCEKGEGVSIFVTPETPDASHPVRVVAVTAQDTAAKLVIVDEAGKAIATADRRGASPFFWLAEVALPPAKTLQARVETVGSESAPAKLLGCQSFNVAAERETPPRTFSAHVWTPKSEWSRMTEDLFSAWIEALFEAPLEETLSWPVLHEVLRDPKRNFLHDHLGKDEDQDGKKGIAIDPDCADLPYFLRAYFAFKLKLPFGYSGCTRGGPSAPPKCVKWRSVRDSRSEPANDSARAFGNFLRTTLADAVHSGNGRIPATSDDGDYYPVPLTAASLRPGTIFADPYGHVLIIVKRLPQTNERGGILLAVDGQPDGTVARRRFWRGNFLFTIDPLLGSAGFKRFRPISLEGRPHALKNDQIAKHPDYGDYALDQYAGTTDDFYENVEAALSPNPLDPERALLETIDALEEQVKGRVRSVQNGVEYFQKGGSRIDMPDGGEIFETTGPWEDFSTPSRDLRLLIAIDIVLKFPERVEKRTARFAMPAGKSPQEVRTALAEKLKTELEKRRVAYTRSDGSSFSLSLAEVTARAVDLEMAYNPNDCPEVRWGAPKGSDEASTCKRRAPGDQRLKMTKGRGWFRDRKRPARGT